MRRPALPPSLLLRLLWHLPSFLKLYYRLFLDPRVPHHARAVLILGLVYLGLPLDLVPEITRPFLGLADDAVVVAMALRAFITLCPPSVVEEHVRRIDADKRTRPGG